MKPSVLEGSGLRPVLDYYDRLAPEYDSDRFGNSYGAYIDRLERAILAEFLENTDRYQVIDFGCGTGRLLNFAQTGIDGSAKMLELAAAKYPDRKLIQADLTRLLSEKSDENPALHAWRTGVKVGGSNQPHTGICLHVLMHLDEAAIRMFLSQVAQLLGENARLTIDIPSAPRRALGRRPASGWHGDTSATLGQLCAWAGPQWVLKRWRGILFMPIHRVPSKLRPLLLRLDALLGRSVLARFSSYYVVELERTR